MSEPPLPAFPLGEDPNGWYVLVCHDCNALEIPFTTARERAQWAVAHTDGTGHERRSVVDVPRSSPPN